jgi:hypothetical protein
LQFQDSGAGNAIRAAITHKTGTRDVEFQRQSDNVVFKFDNDNASDRLILTEDPQVGSINLNSARNFIDGLILSNGTDTSNDIDVAEGACADSDNEHILIGPAWTKMIDNNWAVGDGVGGFPSVLTLTASTWYHFFIIKNTVGTIDYGWDTSADASNLLSDASSVSGTTYSYYRHIGWVYVDSDSAIEQFHQQGDNFWFDDPTNTETNIVEDYGSTSHGTNSPTLIIPPATNILVEIFATIDLEADTSNRFYNVRPTWFSEQDANDLRMMGVRYNSQITTDTHYVLSDANSQLRWSYVCTQSGENIDSLDAVTNGWRDMRGKE